MAKRKNFQNDDDFRSQADPTEHWQSERGFVSNEAQTPQAPPVQIPVDLLSADALDALIEAFILREGTDYGENEVAHQTKHRQVRDQLASDDVKIIFDPDSETVTLLRSEEWRKLGSS